MRYCFIFLFFMTAALQSGELRIVSLSPAITELICHLGKKDLLVGRSDVCDFPESVKTLPVAGRFARPFVEKILALKPDLVITNDFVNPGVKINFKRSGIMTLQLPCRNLTEYRKCVELLGRELKVQKAAAAEIARIDALISRKPADLKLRVLWVVWDSPLMTPGNRSHLHEILRLAGVENATGGFNREYLRPSFESLLTKPIDVMIWSASSSGWKERRIWQKFQAVKNNRVLCSADQSKLLRPGPRMIDGIEELKRSLKKWRRP